jgi:hypothetical protein
VFDTEEGRETMTRFQEMCDLLDKFEASIFGEWQSKIPTVLENKISKSLLSVDAEKLIYQNFDEELVHALKEIKHLKLMDIENIPQVALDFFALSEQLWVSLAVSNLS